MHGVSKTSDYQCVNLIVNYINRSLMLQRVRWPDNIEQLVQRFHCNPNTDKIVCPYTASLKVVLLLSIERLCTLYERFGEIRGYIQNGEEHEEDK